VNSVLFKNKIRGGVIMARTTGGPIGNFRGRLGKYSARVVNGETILSARCENFKESTNPKHIEVKEKFGVTSTFTKGVLELPALFQIWKLNKTPKNSEFNMVFSYNYAFSSPNAPTMQNIITPHGFVLPNAIAEIKDGKVTVSLPALNSAITVNISEVNISVNALISNYEPIINTDPFFKITSISKEVIDFNFNEPYTLEMQFGIESSATIGLYKKRIIFLAVATKSAYNEIVRYSQSLSLPSD
jgi:hypothetical protein